MAKLKIFPRIDRPPEQVHTAPLGREPKRDIFLPIC